MDMARPLSEEKRSAILTAATLIVSDEGVEAATARIARAGGVAEGTVFTYFPTKDALLNELYLTIKRGVAEAVLADSPVRGTPADGLRSIWTNYIRWGLEHPAERRAMVQLAVSGRVSEETRTSALRAFEEVDAMLQSLVDNRFSGSVQFASAIMSALADTTVQFIISNPDQAETIIKDGFDAVLRAIAGVK
jgi:AcrR family transcriptional regulator